MQWYYVENGQQAGPTDEAGLSTLVQQGRINAQTLVWCPTMTNWQPYGEIAATVGGGQYNGGASEMGATTATATASAMGSVSSAVYCAECGRAYPSEDMLQYGGAYVCPACKPLFFQKIREGVTPGVALRYAGFGTRLAAYLVDYLLLIVINYIVGFALGSTFEEGRLLAIPFSILFPLTYYTYLHGKFGQTLGKMAVGIRVVYYDGSPISYARALGRYFAAMLSGMILLIGYLMAAFDDQKRTLHDRICDTRVIHVQK